MLQQKQIPSYLFWGGQGRHFGRTNIWVHSWRKMGGNQGERKGSFQLNDKQVLKHLCVWGLDTQEEIGGAETLSCRDEMEFNDEESCSHIEKIRFGLKRHGVHWRSIGRTIMWSYLHFRKMIMTIIRGRLEKDRSYSNYVWKMRSLMKVVMCKEKKVET